MVLSKMFKKKNNTFFFDFLCRSSQYQPEQEKTQNFNVTFEIFKELKHKRNY